MNRPKIIQSIAAISLLVNCLAINAKTFIYFYNHTPFSLTMKRGLYGKNSPVSSAWGTIGNDIIKPGEGRKVMWFNRDKGIKNGVTYKFTVSIYINPLTASSAKALGIAYSASKPLIMLEQKLVGKFIGSSLAQAVGGPGFGEDWKTDRNLYQQSFKRGQETFTLSYKAITASATLKTESQFDDIEYALNWSFQYPPPKVTAANEINIGFQNLWMRPAGVAIGCTEKRAKMIAPIIGSNYDVLVFSEAFSSDAKTLFTILKNIGYRYQTKIVGEGTGLKTGFTNGGVAILSKYPIETQKEIIFKNSCSEEDCLAAKGVMYAKINKQGKRYHIFGSHTNASYGTPSVGTVTARAKQFRDIKTFIDQQNIPKTEPVFIIGDLNVNMINPVNKYKEFTYQGLFNYKETGSTKSINEYTNMLAVMNAIHPTVKGYTGTNESMPSNQQYTANPSINVLATDAAEKFVQFLDYVLISKNHLQPTQSYNEMRMYSSTTPYTCEGGKFGLALFKPDIKYVSPISDHWFIYGHFKFPQ